MVNFQILVKFSNATVFETQVKNVRHFTWCLASKRHSFAFLPLLYATSSHPFQSFSFYSFVSVLEDALCGR